MVSPTATNNDNNMAQVELIMPKMGESIIEATILRWTKNVGDRVEADETILEIATDKVDSEVPSPSAGVIAEIFFKENDVVPVGKAIAIIATEGETVAPKPSPAVIRVSRPRLANLVPNFLSPSRLSTFLPGSI